MAFYGPPLELAFNEHARETLDAAAARLTSAIRGTPAPAPGREAMNGVLAWLVRWPSGRVGVELERRSAEVLRDEWFCTITALVAAPPEGAPSYADLVGALREAMEACRVNLVFAMQKDEQILHAAFVRADDLLSRLPKVSPSTGEADV